MTTIQLKTQIDSQITNATVPNSVTQIIEGNTMKDIVDHADLKSTAAQSAAIAASNAFTSAAVAALGATLQPSYKELSGKIQQSGTSNPVLTIYQNDFGQGITAVRVAEGIFSINLPNVSNLQYNKGLFFVGDSNDSLPKRTWINKISDGADISVGIYSFSNYTNTTPSDGLLDSNSFLIRIYN